MPDNSITKVVEVKAQQAKIQCQSNVCFIKIRSKHISNKLLSLLRIFMKQTLSNLKPSLFNFNT